MKNINELKKKNVKNLRLLLKDHDISYLKKDDKNTLKEKYLEVFNFPKIQKF